jgi:hypothetical protein
MTTILGDLVGPPRRCKHCPEGRGLISVLATVIATRVTACFLARCQFCNWRGQKG